MSKKILIILIILLIYVTSVSAGGYIIDILKEGESKTYSIGRVEYKVTLEFVTLAEAKFRVNDELTTSLSEGELYKLSDGDEVFVDDIFSQEFEGGMRKARFYLISYAESVGNMSDEIVKKENKTEIDVSKIEEGTKEEELEEKWTVINKSIINKTEEGMIEETELPEKEEVKKKQVELKKQEESRKESKNIFQIIIEWFKEIFS